MPNLDQFNSQNDTVAPYEAKHLAHRNCNDLKGRITKSKV